MPSLDPIIEEIHLQNEDSSPESSREFPFSSSTVILSDTTQNRVADQKQENSDIELFQGIEEELEDLMKRSGIPHLQGESPEDFIHALKKKRRGFVVTSSAVYRRNGSMEEVPILGVIQISPFLILKPVPKTISKKPVKRTNLNPSMQNLPLRRNKLIRPR
jgi:hypothetical protein